MKLTKGYTLSQFIDKISNETDAGELELFEIVPEYYKIILYNDFLKQPLKKEMFVNEIEKPLAKDKDEHNSYNGLRYVEWVKAYREAEKKVIFKGWHQSGLKTEVYIEINKELMYSIEFSQDGIIFYTNEPYGCLKSKNIKTISDLFQATNGELETQNINL